MNKNVKKATSIMLVSSILLTSMPVNVFALTKQETVYGKLEINGAQKSVTVNEHIVNNKEINKIEDYSELKDILNLNGDEKYTIKDNKVTWEANGNDIFYQGTYEDKLPIDANITYKLDGKTMNVSDMLGKSGKVTIKINLKNNDRHLVKVNGKSEYLYTPFVVTLGTIIDGNAKNVTINNGKVINNGTKNIVVGVATPGLYDSLKISSLSSLNNLTISYTTDNFELSSMYMVATPKLLDSDDLKIFDELDSLYGKVNSLQDNMNLIDESGKKIKDGSNTLKSKLGESINNLSKNTGNALTDEQVSGIENSAVSTVKGMFTDEYKAQIAESAWETVQKSLNSNDPEVIKIVKESVTKAVTEYLVNANLAADYQNCETGKVIVSKGGVMTEEQMKSCLVMKNNEEAIKAVTNAATTAATLSATKTANYVAEKVSKSVATEAAMNSALAVAKSVSGSVASNVANTVKEESIKSVSNSLGTLYAGIDELDSGIIKLSSGISKFNKEGINNISNLVNTKLKDTSARAEKLIELGENYKSVDSNKNLSGDSETKFVLVVEGQKAKDTTKSNTTKTTKVSLWQRIKNLFK